MATCDATVWDEIVVRPDGAMESVFSKRLMSLGEGTQIQVKGEFLNDRLWQF